MPRRNYRSDSRIEDDEDRYYEGENRRIRRDAQRKEEPASYVSTFLQKILILISFIASIILNFLSNTGRLGESGRTIGELSDDYESLITPPDITFSIWMVIYAIWLIFVIFQMLPNSCLSNSNTLYANSTKGKENIRTKNIF